MPAIMAATRNRGVDVVLNSLSGDLLHASWKCLAECGTFVEIGRLDFIGQGKLAMEQFDMNRSFVGVELLHLWIHRPQKVGALLRRVIEFWAAGHIKPVVAPEEYSAAEIGKAFRGMQRGQHIGKLVVSMPENPLQQLPSEPVHETLRLHNDRSYVFAGGLGGLGKAISSWMAERGATEIVFLSRSAGSADDHHKFGAELASLGCTARFVAGDVCEYDHVIRAIKSTTKPIGGVLQASLVLRDSNFLDMRWEDWVAASQPKVKGSWNLHNALLREQSNIPLDFFLLFSSTAATGGWHGQANYHAGNTFVESFAAYRNGLGLAASALNVGFISDAGFVAENAGAMDTARSMGQWFNTESELLECVELMLKPSQSKPAAREPARSQELIQNSLLAMGIRSTAPLSSSRVPWRKDRRMLAYRNIEAQDHLSSSDETGSSTWTDELTRFTKEIGSNMSVLQSAETTTFLATQMGKATLDFIMRPEAEVDLQAPLTAVGLDSLVGLELRGWIRRWFGADVAALEITKCQNLQALGVVVQNKLIEKYSSRA